MKLYIISVVSVIATRSPLKPPNIIIKQLNLRYTENHSKNSDWGKDKIIFFFLFPLNICRIKIPNLTVTCLIRRILGAKLKMRNKRNVRDIAR